MKICGLVAKIIGLLNGIFVVTILGDYDALGMNKIQYGKKENQYFPIRQVQINTKLLSSNKDKDK